MMSSSRPSPTENWERLVRAVLKSPRPSPTENWERLVRAALKRGRAPCPYYNRLATKCKQILEVVHDIDGGDPNISRILREQARSIVANQDPSSSDGLGPLMLNTALASVMRQKHAKKDGAEIDRQNDTNVLWNFYLEYVSLLRADGMHVQPGKLRESGTLGTEMGGSDTRMEEIYATLRASLRALEILVENTPPTDKLGRQILEEIRRVKESDACSITARYR